MRLRTACLSARSSLSCRSALLSRTTAICCYSTSRNSWLQRTPADAVTHATSITLLARLNSRIRPGVDSIAGVPADAAAGGVCSFGGSLAKLASAGTVNGAASTAGKRRFAESIGADLSIDYTSPDWAAQVRALTGGRGVDIVLEMSGGVTVGRALDALARMVVLANPAVTQRPSILSVLRFQTSRSLDFILALTSSSRS